MLTKFLPKGTKLRCVETYEGLTRYVTKGKFYTLLSDYHYIDHVPNYCEVTMDNESRGGLEVKLFEVWKPRIILPAFL